jgi:hypothetical protein
METKLMALDALKRTRSELWQKVESQHGPKFASQYPEIIYSDKAIAALEADIAKPVDNSEQSAFEDWITRTNPSGDVESVQRQWISSWDYADLYTTPQEPALKPFDESALYRAAISCGHEIEHQRITLERDDTKPGNALAQLQQRLNKAAFEMAPQEPAAVGWMPIETAPKNQKEMFIVKAFNAETHCGTRYTSDPWGVWAENGHFIRWPHKFKPTHWIPLPAAPGGAA